MCTHVQELWTLQGRRGNFQEKALSVNIFFIVSRPSDAGRYSHYGAGFFFFCQAGVPVVVLNPEFLGSSEVPCF